MCVIVTNLAFEPVPGVAMSSPEIGSQLYRIKKKKVVYAPAVET
jgi:hypothetical protein